jgi:hypothetical protein
MSGFVLLVFSVTIFVNSSIITQIEANATPPHGERRHRNIFPRRAVAVVDRSTGQARSISICTMPYQKNHGTLPPSTLVLHQSRPCKPSARPPVLPANDGWWAQLAIQLSQQLRRAVPHPHFPRCLAHSAPGRGALRSCCRHRRRRAVSPMSAACLFTFYLR